MNNFDYKNLTPFKWFVLENFPFIENDFDAINNYHLFSKVVEYLNNTINSMNLVGEQMENVTNAMTELQNYVNNYFENLDVQDEINNKLDEMADDGTLENIINQEIFGELNEKIENQEKNKLYGMKINSTRILRKIFETGQNIMNPSGNYYSHCQGFCMIDENTCAIGLIEGSTNYTNNNAKLQVINLLNGNVIKETIDEFGHINDLSYNPDDNLLYIGGCSTYTEQGELIENNRLIILNYDNLTVNDIIELPNTIAGVCYDRTTKKLYVNMHTVVYELDKTSYNIINTINLSLHNIYSGVGQTVKVFDNIIYRVTAFPNILTIFDINGNYINNFVFNSYMDNSFYINELESIDKIGDYIYFNADNHSIANCPLSTVSIGKTSLIKNIVNNDRYLNNKSYGNITIKVDNSKNYINPDGVNQEFSQLFEAIEFVNSPNGLKFGASIDLKNNNIEYFGCLIKANNIREIIMNNNTIGFLNFINCNDCVITSAHFKGTILNRANMEITASNITLYKPNFTNNNTGSNYAILINNSKVNIAGGNAMTVFDGLKISITGSSQLFSKDTALNNIEKQSGVPQVQNNQLFVGNIKTHLQEENYTSNITDVLTQMSRYRYVIFIVESANKKEVIKLEYNSINNYRLNSVRSANSVTGASINLYNSLLTFDAQKITATYLKLITHDFLANTTSIATENTECVVKAVYLSDF